MEWSWSDDQKRDELQWARVGQIASMNVEISCYAKVEWWSGYGRYMSLKVNKNLREGCSISRFCRWRKKTMNVEVRLFRMRKLESYRRQFKWFEGDIRRRDESERFRDKKCCATTNNWRDARRYRTKIADHCEILRNGIKQLSWSSIRISPGSS